MKESKILKEYEFTYKKSILSKKSKMLLIIYDDFLYVECFGYNRGLLSEEMLQCKIEYNAIKK